MYSNSGVSEWSVFRRSSQCDSRMWGQGRGPDCSGEFCESPYMHWEKRRWRTQSHKRGHPRAAQHGRRAELAGSPRAWSVFISPRTRSLSEITVSNYWLRSAVVVLMSPSFSTSLKAHRFLHTLNPAACRVHLGPPCRVLGCQHRKLSTAGVTAEFFYFFCLTATLLCCVRGGFLSVAAPPLCLPACMCVGFHSCATVMVYWAGGAPEAIRARGMRLCTRWSHKGPLWRPCQRVEQTSYLPAKRYPRRSIPQSSTMPTHQEGQGACTRKDRAPRGWGGWLRGTGWAAINFVSYICMRPARHTKPPS